VSDIEAPSNLTLLVGAHDGRVREFHQLFRGAVVAVRTRSRGRLVRAALAHLDAYGVEPPRTVRLDGRLLVRDSVAVIVDPALGFALDRAERRLERLGYRVADVAGVPIDRDRLDVKLWPPRLEVDRAALAAFDREYPPEEPEVELTERRLPVRALALWQGDPPGDGSGARRLASTARLVPPSLSERAAAADLRLARRLMTEWDVRTCPGDDAALLGLLRDGPGS